MSNEINHTIMNQNVINREKLIEYLTYILDTDGELEKFYDRNRLRNNEDDLVPDVLSFRDWLREQTFDNMIRESYFEEYTKDLYQEIGEYDPDSFLHSHINWQDVIPELIDSDYDTLFDFDFDHRHNLFDEEFYYHI